ncbi:hypothetical protein HDU80_008798 [Chytriomyces hyalinus]|nr:hypothetical protein HDU80_008798 [Chytriomyces hyalinus]
MQLLSIAATLSFLASVAANAAKPNIILLLSDDQDAGMNSLDYMPILQKYLAQEGTTFENHYTTTAICCPSRVSILKGQFAHNTNFTDVGPPTGGYDVFLEKKLNEEYLPVWLQRAGYATHYIGKFINGYGVPNHKVLPGGWNSFDALVNPWIYQFYNAVFSRNGAEPKKYPGIHQVDVIRSKAIGILKQAAKSEKPFFLYLSPSAPHTTVSFDPNDKENLKKIQCSETIPAARHKHLFPDAKIPRTPSFNPASVKGKPKYIEDLPLLNETVIETLDHWYRQRLRNLQSVDELLGAVIQQLTKSGQLDNTYIFYSTDNGYHLGLHRLNAGKTSPYEDDVHIPLLVRGPGVGRGVKRVDVSSHTDLAPTFLKLAGTHQTAFPFDGAPIHVHEHEPSSQNDAAPTKETLAVEFWRPLVPEYFPIQGGEENTYRSLRINGHGYSYLYTVWCNGHRELYNHTTDPYQLVNVYDKTSSSVVSRFDALLVALHDCVGESCQKPWNRIDSRIKSLGQALEGRFDASFAKHQRLVIQQCLQYYDLQNEVIVESDGKGGEIVVDRPVREIPRVGGTAGPVQQPLLVLQDGQENEGVVFENLEGTIDDIEEFGISLTKEEVDIASDPNAYDYD